MIIKNIINIEIEKDGYVFNLSIPMGSSYQLAYDICHELLGIIVKLSNEAEERAKLNSNQPIEIKES